MGFAQYIAQGMQLAGGLFDAAADAKDAGTQKRLGYQAADANESRIRRQTAYELGTQRASAAESGFDPSSGSFLTLQGESAANAELDALTARYQGQLNAWQQDERMRRAEDKMHFVLDPIGTQLGGRASAFLLGPIGSLGYTAGKTVSHQATKG